MLDNGKKYLYGAIIGVALSVTGTLVAQVVVQSSKMNIDVAEQKIAQLQTKAELAPSNIAELKYKDIDLTETDSIQVKENYKNTMLIVSQLRKIEEKLNLIEKNTR